MAGEFEVTTLDLGILVGYLILSRVIPLWLTSGQTEDADSFFLGGRNFIWPLIGFSLFATNMSGASFIGLASAGYNQGVSVYSYEWMAAVILIFFIFFILPFYLRSGVFTLPEFLEKRYDVRSRRTFSGVNLFFNMFIDAAGALYAGGVVVTTLFPEIPLWIGILGLALLAGVLSIFGGLGAVVISDTIQAVVLIIGGIIVAIAAYMAIPSWSAVASAAPDGALSIVQPVDDPNLPWPGLFTGVLIVGIYFWTTNQLIVQRTLGAKSLNHGRWGSIFAGFLKLPILFIMILPGTMAVVLYPDIGNPDQIFPTLVFDLLPVGLRGIILAALVAAITSTVDSILNSASTMVTMDFVKPLNPEITQQTLVRVGQVVTTIALVVAVAWAPQIRHFPTLWDYLQSVLSYTTPPIVVTFLGGILWARANRHGAFYTLIIGIPLGAVGLIANEGLQVFDIQFLYAAGVSFVLSTILFVTVSLATAPPPQEKVEELTWRRELWEAETRDLEGVPLWQNYRYQSIVLFLTTAAIVIWFW
jgi:SSS family solute:Na+ symporter